MTHQLRDAWDAFRKTKEYDFYKRHMEDYGPDEPLWEAFSAGYNSFKNQIESQIQIDESRNLPTTMFQPGDFIHIKGKDLCLISSITPKNNCYKEPHYILEYVTGISIPTPVKLIDSLYKDPTSPNFNPNNCIFKPRNQHDAKIRFCEHYLPPFPLYSILISNTERKIIKPIQLTIIDNQPSYIFDKQFSINVKPYCICIKANYHLLTEFDLRQPE